MQKGLFLLNGNRHFTSAYRGQYLPEPILRMSIEKSCFPGLYRREAAKNQNSGVFIINRFDRMLYHCCPFILSCFLKRCKYIVRCYSSILIPFCLIASPQFCPDIFEAPGINPPVLLSVETCHRNDPAKSPLDSDNL